MTTILRGLCILNVIAFSICSCPPANSHSYHAPYGPISNHVALVDNVNGKFAYVTVGAENVVKVYRRGETPKLVATIPTGDLPHDIWQSGDGTRVYVGLENQDAVAAIDTLSNKVIATLPIGQQPQALVETFGRLDVLVNNAGSGYIGSIIAEGE